MSLVGFVATAQIIHVNPKKIPKATLSQRNVSVTGTAKKTHKNAKLEPTKVSWFDDFGWFLDLRWFSLISCISRKTIVFHRTVLSQKIQTWVIHGRGSSGSKKQPVGLIGMGLINPTGQLVWLFLTVSLEKTASWVWLTVSLIKKQLGSFRKMIVFFVNRPKQIRYLHFFGSITFLLGGFSTLVTWNKKHHFRTSKGWEDDMCIGFWYHLCFGNI